MKISYLSIIYISLSAFFIFFYFFFYLTIHSTHFIYGYMASDIWLKTILRAGKETRCCHIGYSFRLAARVLLYASSHRQDNTYHGLCYTSRGALVGTRNNCIQSHSVQIATLVKISYLSIIYISLSAYFFSFFSFLFNDSLNTFYLRLYGLLFPISSKGSFICIIPQTG